MPLFIVVIGAALAATAPLVLSIEVASTLLGAFGLVFGAVALARTPKHEQHHYATALVPLVYVLLPRTEPYYVAGCVVWGLVLQHFTYTLRARE